MRDTVSKSTKLTINKVGSSIRSRSSAFSSADLLRIPPKCVTTSSPTGLQQNKPATRRRIVCFEFRTPAEESNENIVARVGDLLGFSRSRQVLTRLPRRFRSLSKIMVTPLSALSSSVDKTMNENVTPEMVDGSKFLGCRPKKIDLKTRHEVLDATSMRVLGLNQSSSINAELPFLPEGGRMNADMCFTPAPSKRVSRAFSPPVLHQSVDIDFHLFSTTMPRELFLPDDF